MANKTHQTNKVQSSTEDENNGNRLKYNLREKNEKDAPYRQLIRPELAEKLYNGILSTLIIDKKYRDPMYSARRLAEDLETNTRYISAVINVKFGCNYSSLVNKNRIRDAKLILSDKRSLDKDIDDISNEVGFSNRQSFYAAFYRFVGVTPRQYRLDHNASYRQRFMSGKTYDKNYQKGKEEDNN